MVFSSFVFLFAFLPVTLFFYYVVFKKSLLWKNITLLIVSLFFYAFGEPYIVFLMILSILFNYLFGLVINKVHHRKLLLFITIIFNFSFLFIFKYFNFTVDNIELITGRTFNTVNIALPIGISFYTFQALSYVIDVYRGDVKVQKNPFYVALYVAFFPQLIAGPIVRYSTIEQQITERNITSGALFTSGGVERFILGLSKKVIISNNVGFMADKIFSLSSQELSSPLAWLGALAYTLQIYFDFSGYSDMAIGLGLMFGFKFEENFNYPYISGSVTEFWRRWHISLSTWFRDYVYIPLGGNRVSKSRNVFNLFVVWFCTGLWHGANWTFILWGLYYFVLLIIEKNTHFEKKLKGFSHVYTLLAVMLGWVLFRSDNISIALNYIKTMFTFTPPYAFSDFMWYIGNFLVFLIAGIIFSFPIVPALRKFDNKKWYPAFKTVSLILLFTLTLSFMFRSTYNPFIYFNF